MPDLDPYTITAQEFEELRKRHGLDEDAPLSDFPEFAAYFLGQALAIADIITRGVTPMAHEFSLSAIVPNEEPLTFRDDRFGGDGQVYTVSRKTDFGAVALASLQRVQAGYTLANRQMRTEKNQAAFERAAKDLEKHLHDLMALLIPKMPADRIDAIPMQVKAQFLTWWQVEQVTEQAKAAEGAEGAEGDDQGEAPAPQKPQRTPRGKRSRALSPVTD